MAPDILDELEPITDTSVSNISKQENLVMFESLQAKLWFVEASVVSNIAFRYRKLQGFILFNEDRTKIFASLNSEFYEKALLLTQEDVSTFINWILIKLTDVKKEQTLGTIHNYSKDCIYNNYTYKVLA